MLRLLSACGVFLLIVGLALFIAMIVQAITGCGSWIYGVLGAVAAVPAAFTFYLLLRVRPREATSFSDRLGFALLCIPLALFILPAGCGFSRAQAMERHRFDTWVQTAGKASFSTVLTRGNAGDPASQSTSSSFTHNFWVENMMFTGWGSGKGEAAMGSPVTVWHNPRDPHVNVGVLGEGVKTFPIAHHPPQVFAATAGALALAMMLVALALSWPLSRGWWLPIIVAGLIAGAAFGGHALGQARAQAATKWLDNPTPDTNDPKYLYELWRRNDVDNAPTWKGMTHLQWALALDKALHVPSIKIFHTIGAGDEDAIPLLVDLYPLEGVRAAVLEALRRMNAQSNPAVPQNIRDAMKPAAGPEPD